MGSLLWEDEGATCDVYRVKGMVNMAGSSSKFKYIVQGVHELFDIQPSSEPWSSTTRHSKVWTVMVVVARAVCWPHPDIMWCCGSACSLCLLEDTWMV